MRSILKFLTDMICNLIKKLKKSSPVFYINGPDLLPAPKEGKDEN